MKLHYITLVPLHHITSHRITSHHITSHHITSHYITSHYMTSHDITLHRITLHHIALHFVISHYIALHNITSHYFALHHITSHHIYSLVLFLRFARYSPLYSCCHKLLEPNRPVALKLCSEVRDVDVRYFIGSSLCAAVCFALGHTKMELISLTTDLVKYLSIGSITSCQNRTVAMTTDRRTAARPGMFALSHGLTRVSRDCIKILRVLVGLLLVHCDIYR